MARMLIVLNNNLESGGIEIYLLSMLAKLRAEENSTIDIFVPGKIVSEEIASKLRSLGCTIYEQFISGNNLSKGVGLIRKLYIFLKKNHYYAIYVNVGNIVRQSLSLSIACLCNVEIRIAHSHNAIVARNFLQDFFYNILRPINVKNATQLLACSQAAAIYQYGEAALNRAVIIKNGIDTNRFCFRANKRESIRKELGIENCPVIGHVGRFNIQKNHVFLIEIFREIVQKHPTAKLLLIGEGELQETVKKQVTSYGLSQSVIFTGVTEHVEDYMCAMDVFVLPSLFEGLPIVGVEAQASGLPCIFSNSITKEVKLTDRVEFIPLESSAGVWGNEIARSLTNETSLNREDARKKIREAGYDVEDTVRTFLKIYRSLDTELRRKTYDS